MQSLNQWLRKKSEIQQRRAAILDAAAEEGRTLFPQEVATFDDLGDELATVDNHIIRLRAADDANRSSAMPIGKKSYSGPNFFIRKHGQDEQFQGQNFTRRVIAKALAFKSGGDQTAAQIARARWGKFNPQLVEVIKAGVSGGSTQSGEWGSELVAADERFVGDFIEHLSQITVFDKLPLREIPANVTIKGQDGIATGFWVGEGKSIPVSAQDFNSVTLRPLKVAAISVLTRELLEDSSPSAEMLVRDGLATAIGQRTDATFVSAAAAVPNVSPAGILQGLTSLGSNGTTAAALRQDIVELYSPFLAEYNATDLHYVCNPLLAQRISLLTSTLGLKEFPDLNASGGTMDGDPVITGDNVGATNLILLSPKDIYRIGDSGLQVSMSHDATIEQDSSPTGDAVSPTEASATLMSMFQTDSVAIKVVRRINFAKRRATAIQFIGDAQYGVAGATTA